MKLDGTLAVKMWREVRFGITQPQTDPIDDMNGMRMTPYIRREDDIENCIITSIMGQGINFCVDVRTPVKARRDVGDATSTTSEPRVSTPAPPDPAPYETPELGVTSKSRQLCAVRTTKSSLATSFDAVDDFERT